MKKQFKNYLIDFKNFEVYRGFEKITSEQDVRTFIEDLYSADFEYSKYFRLLEYLVNNYTKLGKIFKPLGFEINRGTHFASVFELINKDVENIDFDVYLPSKGINLQRELVWGDYQKSEFVKYLLKGNIIPNLSIVVQRKDGKRISQIIDGKQRLTSVMDFVENKFPIIVDDSSIYYKDFDPFSKSRFRLNNFYADTAYEYNMKNPDEEKILWFLKLNFAGTPQEKSHFDLLTSKL